MSDQPFFLAHNEAIGEASPADDMLHPEQNRGIEGDSLTETQYLGFNIPEHSIHGLGYIWHHVNLRIITGGLMVWRGVKRFAVEAELFDVRGFLNDKALANDLHEVRLENSYAVRVIEPLKRLHMSYEDGSRGNFVDLDYSAITPPVMFGDKKHFEQGLKVRGKLVLRGQEFEVNCRNVRDRSWGKLRPEAPMSVPPVSWMTGCFGDDFIFNCNLMDHAGSNFQATGQFAVPVERALNGGWISRKGRITRIVKAHKQLDRDPESFMPRSVTLRTTEEDGRETTMRGQLVAACPWAVWPNIHANISLMRWEMDGCIGHGDCQDVLWTDYVGAWRGKEAR
jgi:hypothetical protein